VLPGVNEIYLQIDSSTVRLLGTVRQLTEDQITEPSLLPGWTRGHVLTHLARGADAMRNLLTWAGTGVETPAYASQASRDSDIETGARRSAADLYADVEQAAHAFNMAVRELPDRAWKARVRALGSARFAVSGLLPRRLAELELHHTDLGAGYTPADWPSYFVALKLPEPVRSQRRDRLGGPGR
jgi:maleylpyruvate isomerase